MRHRDEETGHAPSRRLKVGVGAATVLLVAAFVVAALVSGLSGGRAVPLTAATASVASASGAPTTDTPAAAELFVHVSGAVNTPGLIRLAPGTRVVDAVEAAGGLAEGADPAGVNLARPLHDGEQLRVPLVGEVVASGDAGGLDSGDAGGAALDLNTATPAQLETLPRIGPALAQRIVDWRTSNGRFAAVTDLLSVTGIGQKLFDGLKDRVTV